MRPGTFRTIHHVAGAACVIAWVFVMGQKAHGEWTRRSSLPDVGLTEMFEGEGADRTRTFGVYHGDVKIGYAASRRTRGPSGWMFNDQAVWRMVLQGVPAKLVSETSALVGDDFTLKSFRAKVDAGVAVIVAEGRVEGSDLIVRIESAGRSYEERVPLDAPPMLPGLVRASIAARRPKAGDSFVIPIFNPLARGIEDLEVVVEDRETLDTKLGRIDTWRITEILRGSIKTRVWVDDEGETVREESPLGMRIEAEPREIALALSDDAPVPDLVRAVAVPVHGDLAAQVAESRVRLRLKNIDPKEFPLLNGGRQLLHEDILTVEQRRLKSNGWFGGYSIPYQGKDLDPWLASEPLVQSEDPAIIAAARQIVDDERDVLRASRLIYKWVNENVEKRNSAGVPSAVEVLQTMSGDCNEHTVLFVALARASGIPARIAVGLVWANARGAGPGLYYHAWPEVYAGVSGIAAFSTPETLGGWYALDPTLGQEPADAGHLRFLVGGLDRQVDLLKLIGKLEVEVLPFETPFAPVVEDTAGSLRTTTSGETTP